MSYREVTPHDLPTQIAEDLFVVHGCIDSFGITYFTRNMTIVRDQGELTLINPVRMDEAGLASLEKLGKVSHVLRLGGMHGVDDLFYVDRYKAEFWSFEGGKEYSAPAISQPLSDGCELPFAKATMFAFNHLKEPEGVILLKRSPGVLLTCDAIQSYTAAPHTPHTNKFVAKIMPLIGFPKRTIIGPLWLKILVQDKVATKAEFKRLLELDFDQLLSAHGTFLENNAHAELEQAFNQAYG